MTTDIAVLDTPHSLATLSLDDLAETANREHDAAVEALGNVVRHAIACGEALLAAHGKVSFGEWDAWLENNCDVSPDSARGYMRLAHYKDKLPGELLEPFVGQNGAVYQPSASRAIHYVRGLPAIFDHNAQRRTSAAATREARRLRKEGLTYDAIAAMLGLTQPTVYYLCNPDKQRARWERQNRTRKRAQAARRALQTQERQNACDRAAKAAGGALEDSYSLIRRAAQRVDEAIMASDDKERRAALKLTLTNLHAAEDAIAKALKVPA